jgi:hypothetical protein
MSRFTTLVLPLKGRFAACFVAVLLAFRAGRAEAQVTTVGELVNAVSNGAPGAIVKVAAGTYELTEPLRPKAGMKIEGAGIGKTILRNASSWKPGNAGLENDEGAILAGIDCSKYLLSLPQDTTDLTLSRMTLTGPEVHGGICGVNAHRLELFELEFRNFLWAGVRAFILDGAKIHDNTFFDSAGKAKITEGSSGGALFLTYFKEAEIWNNRFSRSNGNDGYGVKGREARNSRIHDNTIDVFFSVELPFENDYFVEIDHNYLGGAISIPKYSGGFVPPGGYTFHVHHNYFNTSYAFEYQRNAVEIDHNLFDFQAAGDYGNLISGFDVVAAVGGTKMHNNLISNPGRGIYWNEGVYNDFAFYNNHVRGVTTVTPRDEGLFDFRPMRPDSNNVPVATDFKTIQIRDNIVELTGLMRPLMRNTESYAAVIENNTLSGISDTGAYANASAARPRGPLAPLCFRLGAQHEWTIDGWKLSKTPTPIPPGDCTLVGPVADAGVPGSDAGTAPTDGGGFGADAGGSVAREDAGQTTTPLADSGAGSSDAGPPGATASCGCGPVPGFPLSLPLLGVWLLVRSGFRRSRKHDLT